MDTQFLIGIGFIVVMVTLLTSLLHVKNKEVKKKNDRRETIMSNMEFDINRINESILNSDSLSLMILESRVNTAKSKLKDYIKTINEYSNGVDAFNRGDVMLLFYTLNRMELVALLLEKCYIDEKKKRDMKTLFTELDPNN